MLRAWRQSRHSFAGPVVAADLAVHHRHERLPGPVAAPAAAAGARGARRPASRSSSRSPGWNPSPTRWSNRRHRYDDRPDVAAVAAETIELAFLIAIQQLPPRQRAVLILREVVDWSAADTAAALDMTVAAVNSALQRAKATLREIAQRQDRETHASRRPPRPRNGSWCAGMSTRTRRATRRPSSSCSGRRSGSGCRRSRMHFLGRDAVADLLPGDLRERAGRRVPAAADHPVERASGGGELPEERRATTSSGRPRWTCCGSSTVRLDEIVVFDNGSSRCSGCPRCGRD